ncbi:MAG: YbaB/EbfC family nucleoid-associated protein [Gracilibacteraceae bacterium]|jgi:DNA-binding YbaB/EbfC family protein|nr:YbaB/EbfC family nucleoid-associated protein [Gracilibacteraceae bacterium]
MSMANMNQMLKQAQKLQQDMLKAKEEAEQQTVSADAGGGLVRVIVNGKMEITELKIDSQAFDPDDPEMLEDLIKAAVNRGIGEARAMVEQAVGKLTGGMNIPGLF